jgi:hypothetical protein
MEPSFEQASTFLDQALILYAGGQIEEASQQLADAAAILHAIQLTPAELRPVVVEFPGLTLYEMPLALAGETTAPAALPPAPAEPESKPSLAVAA